MYGVDSRDILAIFLYTESISKEFLADDCPETSLFLLGVAERLDTKSSDTLVGINAENFIESLT